MKVAAQKEEKFESTASEEEAVTTKQWMKKYDERNTRSNGRLSEFEKTMTGMKF